MLSRNLSIEKVTRPAGVPHHRRSRPPTTYATCVPRLVAITSFGQRHGGGVRPSSGNSVSVALMSVAPNRTLANGSENLRCRMPCQTPNAEP